MEDINNLVVLFDYNKEQLEALKNQFSMVDKENKEEVDNAIKVLVKARGRIQNQGKSYRDDANAYNKAVISKEKEYVSIIEPLELELKEVLAEMKKKEIIEVRKELLPMKKEQIAMLDSVEMPADDFILSLDDTQWVSFYAQKMSEHKANQEREAQRVIDEANREEREAKIKQEAEEKAKYDFEQAQIKKEKDEAEQKERDIKKAQEEKAKLEADTKYQEFLKENNFNETTDRIVEKDGIVRMYRLVAEFKK